MQLDMPIFHLGSPRKTDPTKYQISFGKLRKKLFFGGLGGVRFPGPSKVSNCQSVEDCKFWSSIKKISSEFRAISSNFEQCWLWKFVKNRKYSSNVFKEWLSICDDVVIFWWISRKGYSRIDSFDLMLRGFTAGKTESCDSHCRRFVQHVVYVLVGKKYAQSDIRFKYYHFSI